MATKRNLKPRKPGQVDDVENDEIESEEELDHLDDEVEANESKETSASDDTITMSKSDLAAMVDEMVAEMVDAHVEQRVIAEVKAARRHSELHSKGDRAAVELPDQSEIDANKINRSVLTKQGWVCPVVHPSDRLRMQKMKE